MSKARDSILLAELGELALGLQWSTPRERLAAWDLYEKAREHCGWIFMPPGDAEPDEEEE